ncbi:MAG: zinc-dependent metalloprotease [Candidatus Eremiobacteraeota bacterium]|nr:zinc-dependent metalloprotease [Candidatus Eremiobacteraeota bacterium]
MSTSRFLRYCLVAFALAVGASPAARAQDAAKKPEAAGSPQPYDAFTKDAQVSPGFIAIVRKNGKFYLSIPKAELSADLIETSVPSTGLGGFGPAPGEPYVAPARIIHFDRVDNSLILRWPNTYAMVDPNSPQSVGAKLSLPSSVIAVTQIVAESPTAVVISADSFLGDVADLRAQFDAVVSKPEHSYKLDSERSFFTDAKAFPQNTLLRVSQTWVTDSPDTIDNVPDPRSIEVKMTYNLIAAPQDGYMPRIADPRVGYFEQPLLDFQHDSKPTRNVYYVSRWNFMPATPGQPSQAKNPLIFTLSNDIPLEYRDVVRQALLTWNQAFARIGINGAIQVQDQPNDSSFDPDDIRHNLVRWIDASSPQYGAEALIVTDPRTGEEINAGINVDAVMGLAGNYYRYVIAPARGLADGEALEQRFTKDDILAVILHESGHDLGLQHNFIGSMAYSAKDLQSMAFTQKYGVASSVMEYSPINVWPKGTPQGEYVQLALGPYDYHAIKWGYEYVPNASTPQAEVPALNQVASQWSNPMYRFASDEDVDFESGHAIDPRVQQDDLSDHPLTWEQAQLKMLHAIMNRVDQRFPGDGKAYDEARRAFLSPLRLYVRDAVMPAHYLGGEYLSRDDAGDPNSRPPLEPVSRSDEYAAWKTTQTYLFSDAAWRFNPNVLNRLTYSEVSSIDVGGSWVYNPDPRHDVPVVEIAGTTQDRVLDELFAPLTLQRIDDLSTKYSRGSTMTLADLFDWTRDGIFGDIADGTVGKAGVVRRNAQMRFAKRLAQMWIAPAKGTPTDAQALARLQLEDLSHYCAAALHAPLDELTRAHVEALAALAKQALEARATIAAPEQSVTP